MNLTELQMQLRSIEEHISGLQMEIEKMKPQPEDKKKIMFEKITEMASKFPLQNRHFSKASMIDVRAYISCLAYISLADDNNIYDKLLFLCRLSHGMGLPMSSEDIFKAVLDVDEKYFEKACSELKGQKYSFLTDALILVNITGQASEASFRFIADIAIIFECEKEDIHVASMVAKAVLVEDFDILKQIPIQSKSRYMGQFRQHIPYSWIRSQRVKCGSLCIEQYLPKDFITLNFETISAIYKKEVAVYNKKVNESEKYFNSIPCTVKKRLNAGTIVKKGEELLAYEEKVKKKKLSNNSSYLPFYAKVAATFSETDYETIIENKSITAPCDGVVFFIESDKKGEVSEHTDKFLEVYVVSYFDNYTEFCEWHKKK